MHAQIQKNKSLKNLNTFQVGGSARYFFEAKDKKTFVEALDWAEEKNIKIYILGGGSNVLVPDAGIDGLVIHMKNDKRKAMGERIECGAGASLAQVNSLAVANNLSGLEWSVGIPRATIGGAIRGNAEAFGISMSQLLENVEVFFKKNGKFELLSNRMCKFAYRDSLFKQNKDYIIWRAILKFSPKDAQDIQGKMEDALNFRLNNYPRLPSAGSIFANLSASELENANMKIIENEMEGKIKREGNIGAGFLIDIAGLKGKKIGGIKISLEHANHIVNTGNGTAEEVIMMISFIKQQIRAKFNIQLKEEITYFGFA